jgi:hypothetical protein
LGLEKSQQLCEIYSVKCHMEDSEALQQICLFESDIGFFAPALRMAQGACDQTPTFFHVFDLKNPFPGPVSDQGNFSTHTFGITTLLGGVHEERLPASYEPVVSGWRDRNLDFVVAGKPPCAAYDVEKGFALR